MGLKQPGAWPIVCVSYFECKQRESSTKGRKVKTQIACNTHVEKVDIVCRIFGYSFAGITLVKNFGMLFENTVPFR